MYRRILIATDGSKLSRKAITTGVALAAAMGASIVGFHARPTFPMVYYGGPMEASPSAVDTFDAETTRGAEKFLAEIATAAQKAGVAVTLVHYLAPAPAEEIIRTAKKHKCDLIVMASHGRKGVARLLLGSETNFVLTHSHIPVLVTR